MQVHMLTHYRAERDIITIDPLKKKTNTLEYNRNHGFIVILNSN
jgi:hypothetical protein